MKKRSSLCSAGSLKSFLQQTLVHRRTQRHTGSLSLSSSVFSLPSLPPSLPPSLSLSLTPPSFISSTSLHLYPWFAPGIPPVPQYLPLVCCPGFDICSQKRSTAYFGSISPATMALITATKPRLFFFFSTALTHIYLLFIATIISPKRWNICMQSRLHDFSKTWKESVCCVGFSKVLSTTLNCSVKKVHYELRVLNSYHYNNCITLTPSRTAARN